MWQKFTLRTRIYFLVACLLAITLGSSLVTVWFTYRMNTLVASMVDKDILAFRVAQELSKALIMQKGYVTYFFQDGDPEWLLQLQQHHHAFEQWLVTARATADTSAKRSILNEIESEYIHYSATRERVIEYYKAGNRAAGYELHQKARGQLFQIIGLCEKYREKTNQSILSGRRRIETQARWVEALTLGFMPAAFFLAALLAYILTNQILGPIRRLAKETTHAAGDAPLEEGNEVKALSRKVHHLIEDADRTKLTLERSREHLVQAEKLAMIGKLAAGVAHSVRNPLTSVKMRLFSMERTLDLTGTQKEDFEVISEEVEQIESIVRNFLEFSRAPKLKMQLVSPSDVVDMALELLSYRLESFDVEIQLEREGPLPKTSLDPEQLKEVLVNLIINACEAMGIGGRIVIKEQIRTGGELGRWVIISVSDNGPGVPESEMDKVFEPFFSTKEEGTGLGLSIASRIVEEHGGRLFVESVEGLGATFVITLPF
jgi:signal transduction histidine kinase